MSNSSLDTAEDAPSNESATSRDQTSNVAGGSSACGDSDATMPMSASSTTKEKRNWFHSLTRRRKMQLQGTHPTVPAQPTVVSSDELSSLALNLQNNNNEPPSLPLALTQRPTDETATSRKRKDEKNAFQRFRKRIGRHFHSLRHRRHAGDSDGAVGGASGTTDASAEFLTHSPAHKPVLRPIHECLRFNFATEGGVEGAALQELEPEMVLFTHDYKRFIVRKWLDIESPNRVMYKACSEMLSQVWYWGEISRRDAQKQLTDKPTGSFLVRDSETSGCQFTLSFRILNVTLHYRLVYHQNYWHFEELQYESVVEMIEDILYRCTNNNFVCFVRVPNEMQPPFPVILKYPLSRYLKLPHLQDLCRRVIQRNATHEEIEKLPLPPKLREYLSEKRELVFQS